MSTCTQSIGEIIRAARLERGLTQVELAEQCGLTHSGLAQIERGRVTPRIETVDSIGLALDFSLRFEQNPKTSRKSNRKSG